MVDFNAGKSQFKKQADSPAAPAGMAQVSERFARDQQLWIDQGRKGLQPWAPSDSMMEVAPQWYAGANTQGTENGWDTAFYNQMMRQTQVWEQRAMDADRASVFFSQFDPGADTEGYKATGVVTWDDEGKDLRFGDIFVNGKKQGNVYDTFDQKTADTMMSDFTMTREDKSRAFEGLQNNPDALSLAVNAKRQERSDQAMYAPSAERYADDVAAKKQEFEGWQDNALIVGAGLTSAAQGAAFGSAAGPVGALVGGVLGFGLGTLGGYLNQDELVESAARASVISDRANAHYEGTDQMFGGVGTWLQQYGQVGSKLMNVSQNLTKGVAEVQYGDIGDDSVAFYDVNPDGTRKAGGWLQALDVGAALADGFIQFSNPAGRSMYMATMGAVTAGGVGTLMVGEGWNDARGDFDAYTTRSEWVGAVGKTTIDALQVGTAGAIGRAAQASRASASRATAQVSGRSADELATAAAPTVLGRGGGQYQTARKIQEKVADTVLPTRTRDWLARNADDEVLNGLRFRRNAEGKVLSVRPTMQLLAPSEFLRMVPTSFLARQARLVDDGAANYLDDYYNAALSMTRQGSRWRDSLITGYAEAGEEFVQAAFEPMSLSEDLDPKQMAIAAAYGFAGGLGMGLGTLNKRASSEEVVNNRARVLYAMRVSGNPPTEEQWKEITKGMSASEIEKMAIATPEEDGQISELMDMLNEGQKMATFDSPLAREVHDLIRLNAAEKDAARKDSVGGMSFLLAGRSGAKVVTDDGRVDETVFGAHTSVMSMESVMWNLLTNVEGLRVQQQRARQNIEVWSKQLATAQQQGDTETVERLTANIAREKELLADLAPTEAAAAYLVGTSDNPGVLYRLYNAFVQIPFEDAEAKQEAARRFNEVLAWVFDGKYRRRDDKGAMVPVSDEEAEALRKVVELKMVRNPLTGQGSFAVFLPQVSLAMAMADVHGTMNFDEAVLATLNGDHDGDNAVEIASTYVPPEQLANIRRGNQYVQRATTQVVDEKTGEMVGSDTGWKVFLGLPDAEAVFIEAFSDPLNHKDLTSKVTLGLLRLCSRLESRYAPVLPVQELRELLRQFQANVMANVTDARTVLVEGMYDLGGEALLAMGDKTGRPEALQIWNMISTEFDAIQQEFAYWKDVNRDQVVANPLKPEIPKDSAVLKRVARTQAKTHGDALMMLGSAAQTRPEQFLHYSVLYNSATALGLLDAEQMAADVKGQQKLVELYARLGAGRTQSETDEILQRDRIEYRVRVWMSAIIESSGVAEKYPHLSPDELLLYVANMRVPAVVKQGTTFGVTGEQISMLQLLMSRSLDVETEMQEGADADSPVMKKIATLRKLTRNNADQGGHSNTASLALVEMFADEPAHVLLGKASMYIGPHVTVRQVQQLMLSKDKRDRAAYKAMLVRAGAYSKSHGVGNPPWGADVLTSTDAEGNLLMNGYTILIDALATSVSAEQKKRQTRSDTTLKNFQSGLKSLSRMIDGWAKVYPDLDASNRREVLNDMLARGDQRVAKKIAAMFPQAAAQGVVEMVDGRFIMADWVEQALTEKDEKKAAVIWHVNMLFAEWNVMQGSPATNKLVPEEMGTVRWESIGSRFLQTVYILNTLDDAGEQLRLFLEAAARAESIEALYDKINANPVWLAGRPKLLPFDDGVADYQVDAKNVWGGGARDQQVVDAIADFAAMAQPMSKALVQRRADLDANAGLMASLREEQRWQEKEIASRQKANAALPSGQRKTEAAIVEEVRLRGREQTPAKYLRLLDRAIRNAQAFPDAVGPNAMQQVYTAMYDMFFRAHDKGLPPELVRPMGEAITQADMSGFGNAMRAETTAMTSLSWGQVGTNLSKLAKGPVRIQLEDGRVFEIDMSNPKTALDMLADSRTQEFAKLVLFPTLRDINVVGTVQTYSNGAQTGNIGQLLQDTSFASLFNPTDGESRLRQAYRYIGMVEAYIRGKAVEQGSAEAWDEGFFPISNMINSFIVAYTTAEQVTELNIDAVRDELVLAVADVLKTMATVDEGSLAEIQQLLAATLQKRFWGDDTAMQQYMDPMTDDQKEAFIEETRITMGIEAINRADDLRRQMRQTQDPALLAELQRQLDEAERLVDHAENADISDLLSFRSRMEYASVHKTFKLSHGRSSDEKQFDFVKKAAMVRFLGSQERINKFAGYKGKIETRPGTEQNIYQLLAKFRELVWSENDSRVFSEKTADVLTEAQWDQIAEFCAVLTISERSVRSADDTRVLPVILGKNVDDVRKLYDTSWMSLSAPLFDANVLQAVNAIGNTALEERMVPTGTVVEQIVSSLYPKNRLGQWHDRIPMQLAKARKLLDGASVEAAVQMEGVTNEMMDVWIATGFITSEPVDLAEHTSTRVFELDPATSLDLQDYLDREAYIRLHNHTISSLVVTPAGGQPVDLVKIVGDTIMFDESTRASDLRTLNLDVLLKYLAKHPELTPDTGVTSIEVTYVDVNKKPAEPEYANNVYFDGVGRASTGRSEVGLIASMLYAVQGVFGTGLQIPLDAITKQGQSFRAFNTSPLRRAKAFEEQAQTLTELCERKAMWLASQEFPNGRLLVDDLTAVYKYIKSFHVVVGMNPTTKRKEVWPAEKWIAYEAVGGPPPLVNLNDPNEPAEFVANSEQVTQALLGKGGYGIDPSYIDITEMYATPQFSPERLERLGLQHIGEKVTDDERKSTVLGQVTPVTRVGLVDPDKRTSVRTLKDLRLAQWTAEQQAQDDLRTNSLNMINDRNADNKQQLLNMVQATQLGSKLAMLGLPETMTQDRVTTLLNSSYAKRFNELLGGSGILFMHQQALGKGSTVEHLVASQQIDDGFSKMKFPPTYGDGVLVDLQSILDYAGGHTKAVEVGTKILREYARRGVAVALVSKTKTTLLQQSLARVMMEQIPGYTNLGNTGVFFVPSTEPQDYVHETIRSLESTLVETTPQLADNFELNAQADWLTATTEANRIIDPARAKDWRRFQMLLVPANYSVPIPGGNDLMLFGAPQKGTGESAQFNQIAKQLLALTDDGDPDSEGFKRLLKQMGGYGKNIPMYKRNPDGTTTPGVKPPEMALKDFLDALKLGAEVYDEGRTVMAGDLFIRVTGDGNVLLQRIGFKLPETDEQIRDIRTQWETQESVADSPFPKLRIAFGPSKVERDWTMPPPLLVEKKNTSRRLELTGLVSMDAALKLHAEGTGNKTTTTIMDEKTGFVGDLSGVDGNTRGISSITSTAGIAEKGSERGTAHSFRNVFAITGWSVERELMDALVPASAGSEAERRNMLWTLLEAWSKMNHGVSESQILQLMDMEQMVGAFAAELNELGMRIVGSDWTPMTAELGKDRSSANHNIAISVLAALASPSITPEMVVTLPGFLTVSDANPDAQVGFMPALLSQLLNDPRRVEMRQYLIDKANAVFPKITVVDKNGVTQQVPEHYFSGDLTFYVRMYQELPDKNGVAQADKMMLRKVSLQLNKVLASDKNPVGPAWGFDTKRDLSAFNARITAASVGGRVMAKRATSGEGKDKKILASQQEIVDGNNVIMRFDNDTDTVWGMLTRIMPKDTSYSAFTHLKPLEHARLQSTTNDMTSYLHVVDSRVASDDEKKDEKEAIWKKARDLRSKFLHDLGLKPEDWAEVDFLVRQWYGAPGPRAGQKDYTEQITGQMYLEAVSAMRQNIQGPHRLHPLHGAMVPLEHVVFWRKVFEAGKWSPTALIKRGKFEDVPQDWEKWVETLMGQMLDSHQEFLAMFLSPLDGFWVTYQGASPNFTTMSLSRDAKIAAKMMDSEGNRDFLSIDPDARVLMQDPAILESMNITRAMLAGEFDGEYLAQQLRGIEVTEMSDRIAYQKAWLKNNKARPQKKKSVKDYVKEGAQYQESLRDSSMFLRGMVHLSITTRLFNPALWISALGETFFRNQIENVTNLLSGNNLGPGGRTVEKIGSKLGVEPRFSESDLKKLDQLATILGDSTELIAELYGEMTYSSKLTEPGGRVDAEGRTVASGGWLSRLLERTAGSTSRVMNDPRIGMTQKSIMVRYLAAAIEYLELSPNNVVSVDTLVAEMKKDPLWLKKNFSKDRANPHQMGVNAVGNIRSQKNTVVAKLFMRQIETLCAQEGIGTWIGHALKIPFLFTRFNVNALTYLTGMTGADQMLAMTLSGRENPWRSWITRRRSDDPNLEFKPMDFNDVIETLDLSRLFVRGMVTQAGLFTLGMMGAEVLGLGGEDEEERRRRRIATYLNIPIVYDPQKAANDFRYQDAIFLNDIPLLGNLFRKEGNNAPAAYMPHWVMRQFTSPLMGVVRFFDTGDIRMISQGFLDGIAAIPNSVIGLYRDADLVAKQLQESADSDARVDTPEKTNSVAMLGISIVGIYEKALIENQFVNGVRSAFDKYDRNPWLVPMTNPKDNGTLDRLQGSNLPQQTDALEQYQKEVPVLDDNGEPVIGEDGQPVMETVSGLAYMTRDGADAYLHQYAENNTTAAVLLSLFTGQVGTDSSFRRGNMVQKTQNVPIEAVDTKTLEALVYARYFGSGGTGLLSEDDIGSILKTKAEAADVWWKQGEIDAQASKLYAQQLKQFDELKAAILPQLEQRDAAAGVSSSPAEREAQADSMADAMMMGMSISKNGREELTLEGQDAMIKSLMAGMVTFDDPGFQGFYASQEQRDLLQARILDRIVQDGVNRGMTETAAKFRANRYYFGDSTDPSSPGLREILYSNKIPSQPMAEYNQLNATYVIGPDGRPWATPFPRQSILQSLGLPLAAGVIQPTNGMGLDERGNATDLVKNINTGRASLEPTQVAGQVTPNDKILEEIKKKTYTPKDTVAGSTRFGGGYRSFGGGYRRGGGYSRSSGGGGYANSYITRMNFFTGMGAAQIDNLSMINTNSPLVRRADVRRERIASERGRLKQWQ